MKGMEERTCMMGMMVRSGTPWMRGRTLLVRRVLMRSPMGHQPRIVGIHTGPMTTFTITTPTWSHNNNTIILEINTTTIRMAHLGAIPTLVTIWESIIKRWMSHWRVKSILANPQW